MGLLALAAVYAAFLPAPPLVLQGVASQGLVGTGAQGPEEIICSLGGPNDGEPINSRTVELELRTDFQEYATLSIHANGVYFASRSLQVGARVDPDTGLTVVPLEIDLDKVRETLGVARAEDLTALQIRVYLYEAASARLVTFAEWNGVLNAPWIEIVNLETGDPKTPQHYDPPPGMVPALVHTLKGDTFYFAFASPDPAVLRTSPEEARILREARLVSARNCDPSGEKQHRVLVDSTLAGAGAPVYVVVWTYDAVRGWKQSPIVSVTPH